MTAILEQRTAFGAGGSRRLAWFSLVLLITAVAAHRFAFIDTPVLFNVLALVAGLAILSLILAAVAFRRVWNEGDRGAGALTVAVLVALLVLAPFVFAAWLWFSLPKLTDVSTDLENPPLFAAATDERTPDTNPISPPTLESITQQTEAYPDVTGRRYDLPAEQVADLVNALIDQRGWPVTGRRPTAIGQPELTIEALASTPILAFPADVAVRLTDETETTYVDMRSASRYGLHDLGENAARIETFLTELDAEVAKQAGVAPPAQ